MTKQATKAIEADYSYAQSKRARVAGEFEQAQRLNNQAQWHHELSDAVREHGNRLAQNAVVVNTEVLSAQTLKDTLSDPDLAAIESSETRGRLLKMNGVVALGVDIANTANASNTAEKLLAHEVAAAHQAAMVQAMRATIEADPVLEIKRLQTSARLMTVVQHGLLTLQKLKTGGTQNVVVQHVHVESGGQAIVGVQSGAKRN
jgi:folylpolyglutamate synthase/dihydropteroate synthase